MKKTHVQARLNRGRKASSNGAQVDYNKTDLDTSSRPAVYLLSWRFEQNTPITI